MDKIIECPLMESEIELDIYADIHFVVDCLAPSWTAPKKAIEKPNFKEICNSCIHHRED